MLKLLVVAMTCLLVGCSTVNKENLNPYEGLVPTGAAPAASPTPLNVADLKGKSVVIVASGSFEAHVKQYIDYYEGGAGERYKTFLSGLGAVSSVLSGPAAAGISASLGATDIEGQYSSIRKAQDPRVVVDQITKVLVGVFGSVRVASDFAEAQDLKADYIVLTDYWWAPNMMGSAFIGSAAVHLLSKDLKRFFVVDARVTASRPGVSAVGTFEQIHAELSRKLVTDLRQRLTVQQ